LQFYSTLHAKGFQARSPLNQHVFSTPADGTSPAIGNCNYLMKQGVSIDFVTPDGN